METMTMSPACLRLARPMLALLLLLSTRHAFAQSVAAAEPAAPKIFDIDTDPDFSSYRAAVAAFLKMQHARKLNTVCMLGEEYSDGTRSAWVIWHEGKKMILWDGDGQALWASRRKLDLKRDVVASPYDVKFSTYLIPRAWVEEQKRLCEQFGKKLRFTGDSLERRGRRTSETDSS
jgi:hypothetical protein